LKTPTQPKRFITLPLVAGLLIFATMTLTLGEISEDITNHEPITVADTQLSNWLHQHTSPLLTKAMFVATFFGSTAAVSCIAIAFGLFLLSRRRHYWVAAVAFSVGGGVLLNRVLKYFFHRSRPFFSDPLLTVSSFSFPSGHTMAATVLYGTIAAYLLLNTKDPARRLLIVICAGCLILLVAFSRIYLGAHYLSDVLGAMAEGLAWLSLCLTAVHSFWRLQNKSSVESLR